MNHIQDDLREMLHRKAGEVPPLRDVPAGMVRRARRRVARTAIVAAAAVAVLAAGGWAGVTRLAAPSPIVPGGTRHTPPLPSGSSLATTPAPGGPPPCSGEQLRGRFDLQGAAGSVEGSVILTNRATVPCTVRGRPSVSVLAADGGVLPASVSATQPWWQIDGARRPTGWPTVVVQPGASVVLRTRWSNACGPAAPASWRLEADGSTFTVSTRSTPPCNGPAQPSAIEIGPFEPQPAA